MKVVIGKANSPSALMAGTIHYVTFNPYWNIPEDVTQSSIARLVLKRGTKYLKLARYETWSAVGAKGEKVDPDSIDWKAVADGTATAFVRQLPGANNMMGAMKFGFVNDYDIFLHDTPRRALFAKANRMLSLGCIRLEHADRLARWLGKDPETVGDTPEQHVALDKGVPVFVTSLTATTVDGKVAFADDVYGVDRPAQAAAAAPSPSPAAPSPAAPSL